MAKKSRKLILLSKVLSQSIIDNILKISHAQIVSLDNILLVIRESRQPVKYPQTSTAIERGLVEKTTPVKPRKGDLLHYFVSGIALLLP